MMEQADGAYGLKPFLLDIQKTFYEKNFSMSKTNRHHFVVAQNIYIDIHLFLLNNFTLKPLSKLAQKLQYSDFDICYRSQHTSGIRTESSAKAI